MHFKFNGKQFDKFFKLIIGCNSSIFSQKILKYVFSSVFPPTFSFFILFSPIWLWPTFISFGWSILFLISFFCLNALSFLSKSYFIPLIEILFSFNQKIISIIIPNIINIKWIQNPIFISICFTYFTHLKHKFFSIFSFEIFKTLSFWIYE